MLSEEVKKMVEQTRRDGYVGIDVSDRPITLDKLIQFVQDMFPNHGLHQLAINHAEDDKFVVAALLCVGTQPN